MPALPGRNDIASSVSHPRLRLLGRIVGRLITVAAFVFIVIAIRREWEAVSARLLPLTVWPAIIGLAVVYGSALMLVAEVWHQLICDFSRTRLPRNMTLPSYALSQLAKYVPGNIFQYVGRHSVMSRAGVANAPLLRAMTWDIGFLLIGASLTALISFALFPIDIVFLSGEPLRNVAIGGAVAAVIMLAALRLSPWLSRQASAATPQAATAVISIPMIVCFFTFQATVFTSIGALVTGGFHPELATVAVIAWVAGFLPLGTPAGLGTREAVIVLLAGPLVGPADSIVVAALFRLTTSFGDCICFAIGFLISASAARLRSARNEIEQPTQTAPLSH